MFCGVSPPHRVNNFISSNITHEPSELLYFFLHLSRQKQPFCLLNIKLNSPSCGTSDSVSPWEPSFSFQSIKEQTWRAKGWWLAPTRLFLSTNQPCMVCWTGLLMSNPIPVTLLEFSLAIISMESFFLSLELCLKQWESPVWSFPETKHLPVSKGKKKDVLQWKCYLRITDLAHLFRQIKSSLSKVSSPFLFSSPSKKQLSKNPSV